ncbi:MAG: phosphatase PAP2 family protein [Rickettsiales endosymbiont of Dermacentor nuttalli]
MHKSFYVITSVTLLVIAFSYNFLDKKIVYFFHTLNTHQYKILDHIAEIPSIILSLVPVLIVYLWLKLALNKVNNIDKVSYIISLALSVSFTIRETLKFVFGRSWPATFYNNPSLLSDNVYGFHWFSFNYLHKSFPSGHMITISSMCTVLCMLYTKTRYLWISIIIFVGASQLILYYHFFSDIIAGVYIGAITGYFTVLYHLRSRLL